MTTFPLTGTSRYPTVDGRTAGFYRWVRPTPTSTVRACGHSHPTETDAKNCKGNA